ncbi:hypothetical protein OAO18_03235 [Francisellaceae bacterium]|nr:hypothetical protein [Francisellaceae bacterium]
MKVIKILFITLSISFVMNQAYALNPAYNMSFKKTVINNKLYKDKDCAGAKTTDQSSKV